MGECISGQLRTIASRRYAIAYRMKRMTEIALEVSVGIQCLDRRTTVLAVHRIVWRSKKLESHSSLRIGHYKPSTSRYDRNEIGCK